MQVHTDFTSNKHTLVFEDGERISLTKEQSREFEKWYERKKRTIALRHYLKN